MKASELVSALTRHYTGGPGHRDADSHATYTEVPFGPDGVGRRIDFLAVSLWGSRGVRLEGHEIKVSRSDWLTELAQPSKADTWWQMTSRWWVVVPDESIVRDGELPDGWGLMVPPSRGNARAMRVVVEAAERVPEPPLWLLARLLLNDKRAVGEARRVAREEGRHEERQVALRVAERNEVSDEDREDLFDLRQVRSMLPDDTRLRDLGDDVSPWALGRALALMASERKQPSRHDVRQLEAQAAAADRYAESLRVAAKAATEVTGRVGRSR